MLSALRARKKKKKKQDMRKDDEKGQVFEIRSSGIHGKNSN